MYIDVYKGDDKIATSGVTLLSDLDLQETYRAIDSVATGRIPSLSCGVIIYTCINVALSSVDYSAVYIVGQR